MKNHNMLLNVITGAALGALSFFVVSGFVCNDYSPNVMQWTAFARAYLVVFALLGAWCGVGYNWEVFGK